MKTIENTKKNIKSKNHAQKNHKIENLQKKS